MTTQERQEWLTKTLTDLFESWFAGDVALDRIVKPVDRPRTDLKAIATSTSIAKYNHTDLRT
jgi:hypothetical protein